MNYKFREHNWTFLFFFVLLTSRKKSSSNNNSFSVSAIIIKHIPNLECVKFLINNCRRFERVINLYVRNKKDNPMTSIPRSRRCSPPKSAYSDEKMLKRCLENRAFFIKLTQLMLDKVNGWRGIGALTSFGLWWAIKRRIYTALPAADLHTLSCQLEIVRAWEPFNADGFVSHANNGRCRNRVLHTTRTSHTACIFARLAKSTSIRLETCRCGVTTRNFLAYTCDCDKNSILITS